MSEADAREILGLAYICAACGAFAYTTDTSLDSGTTFTCDSCGGKTVVSLDRPGEVYDRFKTLTRERDEARYMSAAILLSRDDTTCGDLRLTAEQWLATRDAATTRAEKAEEVAEQLEAERNAEREKVKLLREALDLDHEMYAAGAYGNHRWHDLVEKWGLQAEVSYWDTEGRVGYPQMRAVLEHVDSVRRRALAATGKKETPCPR